MQLGGLLVDGQVIASLYRSRISIGAIVLMVASALVAVLAALLVSDAGEAVLAWLAQTWFLLVDQVRALTGGWI
jgi:uncharacterized membrane-anchored protein